MRRRNIYFCYKWKSFARRLRPDVIRTVYSSLWKPGAKHFISPSFFSYSLGGMYLTGSSSVVRIPRHRSYSSSLFFLFVSRYLLLLSSFLFLPLNIPSCPAPSPCSKTALHITGTTIWLRIIDRLNRVCIQISNGVYVYVRVWVCVWGAAQEETQPPPRPDFPSFHAPSRLVGFEGLH